MRVMREEARRSIQQAGKCEDRSPTGLQEKRVTRWIDWRWKLDRHFLLRTHPPVSHPPVLSSSMTWKGTLRSDSSDLARVQ